MIDGVLLQHPDLRLMQCPQLRSHRNIFAQILIAQFAKTDLSWVPKQGKCHVIIYIIQIVLSHGWFSTTLVLFAAMNCHLRDRAVVIVIKPQAVEIEVAVIVVIPMEGRTVGIIREDEVHGRFCGHSAHLTLVLTTTKQVEAAQQLCMKIFTNRRGIMDGLLIKVSMFRTWFASFRFFFSLPVSEIVLYGQWLQSNQLLLGGKWFQTLEPSRLESV